MAYTPLYATTTKQAESTGGYKPLFYGKKVEEVKKEPEKKKEDPLSSFLGMPQTYAEALKKETKINKLTSKLSGIKPTAPTFREKAVTGVADWLSKNTALGLIPVVREAAGLSWDDLKAYSQEKTNLFKSSMGNVGSGKELTTNQKEAVNEMLLNTVDIGGLKVFGKEAKIAASKSTPEILNVLKTVFKKSDDELKPLANNLVKITDPENVKTILKDFAVEDLAKSKLSKANKLPDLPTLPKVQVDDLAKSQELPPLGQSKLVPETIPTTVQPEILVNGVPPEKLSSYSESVNKLRESLSKAQKLRGRQEQLYTAERSKRIQKVLESRQKLGGEAGYYEELSKLKGEMPKVEYESIKDSMSQTDIDNLFNAIKESNAIGDWEKLPAQKGLAKMFGEFGGTVPTEKELELIGKVFPKEIVEELLSKRDIMKLIGTGVFETLNVPRSIMSSADLSAPFRQGIFMVTDKNFWKDLSPMIKSAFSEKYYQGLQNEILSRPNFKLMQEAKLALTDLGSLTSREEAFLSNIAEKIPGLGKLVRGSSRAYTGFLSKLRADVFDDLVKKFELSGRDVVNDKKLLKDTAIAINTLTGRGKAPAVLGKSMANAIEQSAPALNAIFFSPRLMFSRLNVLDPSYYVKLDPIVRKEVIKKMVGFAGVASTVLGLAQLAGAEVNKDPRNADFGKIKFGNTRIDVLGGLQQYIRIAAQLWTGKIISSTTGKEMTLGEGYRPLTRLDILERFFMNKEAPIASFVTSWLQGTNSVGEKFSPSKEIVNRFVPMIMQDIKETLDEQGAAKALGITALGVLGFGAQTYGGNEPGKLPKLPNLPTLPQLPKLPKLPSL
jgi:hypothetical protein